MKQFTVSAPDGGTYRIEMPDGATEAEAQAAVRKRLGYPPAASPTTPTRGASGVAPPTTPTRGAPEPANPLRNGDAPDLGPLGPYLDDPTLAGTVVRAGAGFMQGVVDPLEAAAQPFGLERALPQRVQDRLGLMRQISQGGAGRAGRLAGTVLNPGNWLVPEIRGMGALGTLAQSVGRGALGALSEPAEQAPGESLGAAKLRQAEGGGAIGGLLGIPGSAARAMGFSSAQVLGKWLPFIDRLKRLSLPSFNRTWLSHALEPIGETEAGSGFAAMDDAASKIGGALDRATAGMSLRMSPETFRGLSGAVEAARRNMNDQTYQRYRAEIQRLLVGRLRGGSSLTPSELQSVTSDLAASIRAIRPSSDENRTLRAELEEFRTALFDHATGTAEQKQAYARARDAWRRYAVLRDAVPLGSPDGLSTWDDVAREINRRETRYARGTATDQAMANQAQQSLLRAGAAARQASGGLPLSEPQLFAQPGGALAAGAAPPPDWRDQRAPY